mgnify:FL=1
MQIEKTVISNLRELNLLKTTPAILKTLRLRQPTEYFVLPYRRPRKRSISSFRLVIKPAKTLPFDLFHLGNSRATIFSGALAFNSDTRVEF